MLCDCNIYIVDRGLQNRQGRAAITFTQLERVRERADTAQSLTDTGCVVCCRVMQKAHKVADCGCVSGALLCGLWLLLFNPCIQMVCRH